MPSSSHAPVSSESILEQEHTSQESHEEARRLYPALPASTALYCSEEHNSNLLTITIDISNGHNTEC